MRSKNIDFPRIATFTCAGMTIIYLINAIVFLITTKINGGATDSAFVMSVINYFINVIFYFALTGQFMRSKGNFANASNGIRILLLCNYIIPIILNGLTFILFNPLYSFYYLSGVVISFGTAIAYFVLFCVDRKKHGSSSGVQIAMIVLGAIMAASSLLQYGSLFISNILIIVNSNLNIYSIVNYSFNLIVYIFNFLETFLYLLFAIYLRKYTHLGY